MDLIRIRKATLQGWVNASAHEYLTTPGRGMMVMLALFACALVAPRSAYAQPPREYKDLIYATVDGKRLGLDLYMPAGVKRPPLLVWVHGGAWREETKARVPPVFVERGIATASLDFRQSIEAPFPAQIHDIKAAIRYLRANAAQYGYRSERIAIGGASSGGHLAALAGVTNGERELEGNTGEYLDRSSSVQAIVDYSGPSNLVTLLEHRTPSGQRVHESAVGRLLGGGTPDQTRARAESASPVNHVDRGDPPLLLLHGDQDQEIPIGQAQELEQAYAKLGLDVQLRVVRGAGHGGHAFYSPAQLDAVLAFLRRTIGG